MKHTDRQRGCFLGLATGDALGAAIEFRAPGTFKPVTGYRRGGQRGLAPGEWTDDTSMALAERLSQMAAAKQTAATSGRPGRIVPAVVPQRSLCSSIPGRSG
jgi:ADP-ribosylglycohydrolase